MKGSGIKCLGGMHIYRCSTTPSCGRGSNNFGRILGNIPKDPPRLVEDHWYRTKAFMWDTIRKNSKQSLLIADAQSKLLRSLPDQEGDQSFLLRVCEVASNALLKLC